MMGSEMGELEELYEVVLGDMVEHPHAPAASPEDISIFAYYEKYMDWLVHTHGVEYNDIRLPYGKSAYLWDPEANDWKVTHVVGNPPNTLDDYRGELAVLVPEPYPAGVRMVPAEHVQYMNANVGLYHTFMLAAAQFAVDTYVNLNDRADGKREAMFSTLASDMRVHEQVTTIHSTGHSIEEVFHNDARVLQTPSRPPEVVVKRSLFSAWLTPSLTRSGPALEMGGL